MSTKNELIHFVFFNKCWERLYGLQLEIDFAY